jgi:hypothetical protein
MRQGVILSQEAVLTPSNPRYTWGLMDESKNKEATTRGSLPQIEIHGNDFKQDFCCSPLRRLALTSDIYNGTSVEERPIPTPQISRPMIRALVEAALALHEEHGKYF